MSTEQPAGMTARALMEAAASAALARYLQAVGEGIRRADAERAYRDHVLKAWDKTIARATDTRTRPHDGMVRGPEAQAARLRSQAAS